MLSISDVLQGSSNAVQFYNVTIQMEAIENYFPVLLFSIVLFMALDEILNCNRS